VPGLSLLLILAAHLVLTGLPGVAATLLAARCGVRVVPVLLAIALAVSGGLAMLTFWAYYADPMLGESLSYLSLFGSIALTGWALYGGNLDPSLLRHLATPLFLWALGSTFLVLFGFAHGGTGASLSMASTRFSDPLPTDNDIPLFFSNWFFSHGHHGVPPVFPGHWLASDRPPLQIGYELAQRPFEWGSIELHYQVLGVVLQQLWIVGLWGLLVAARVGRITRGLTMFALLISDLTIVHGFYVWPKLLPAAMLLATAGLIVTPLWFRIRRDWRAAALVAALFSLAVLGHGSSVFGVLTLVIVAAIRGIPSWRWLGIAVLVGAVLLVPWSMYQKYGDPPGNRLTKWMIGGVVNVDRRSTSEAILDSYREVGFGGALHNKAENFAMMAGGGQAVEAVERGLNGGLGGIVREARTINFFYLFPSLDLLLLAPFIMLAVRVRGRRNAAEWRFAVTCFVVALVGCLFWGLLMFGNVPSRTSIHIGSLAIPLLLFCGAVVGLRATFPRFAIWYVGLSALLTLTLYFPALDPSPGTSYSAFALIIAAISMIAFALVAFTSRSEALAMREA
jgi:hypothetical protein